MTTDEPRDLTARGTPFHARIVARGVSNGPGSVHSNYGVSGKAGAVHMPMLTAALDSMVAERDPLEAAVIVGFVYNSATRAWITIHPVRLTL